MTAHDFNLYMEKLHELDDTELSTLLVKCEFILENRKAAAREKLRQELIENLRLSLYDIQSNGFTVLIQNKDLDIEKHKYAAVCIDPDETFLIDAK